MSHNVVLVNDGSVIGVVEVPEEVPGVGSMNEEVARQYSRLIGQLESEGVEYLEDTELTKRFAKHLACNRIPARSTKVIIVDINNVPEAS